MDANTFVERLMLEHGNQPYDPQKRREYYLRTRQLIGRKAGSQEESSGGRSKNTRFNSTLKVKRAESTARREEVKARVEQLQAKLEKLENILRAKVAEAKIRSGIKSEEAPKKQDKGERNKPAEKLTAKEKKEAAERAKEAREKEKKTTPNQEVAELEAKIAETRVKIQEAIAEAREKARKKKPQASTSDRNGTRGR